MEKNIKDLEQIFEKANKSFIRKNTMLFETRVSERTVVRQIRCTSSMQIICA